MSSLIANKVKTNKCSVLIKFFIVRIILCATISNLYNKTTTCSLYFFTHPFS